jgi:dihydrofolate synthase/folylpolyglutamate synthase
MNYSEAIAYLHSLTDYEKTRIERYTPETFGLSRVKKLVAELDDPHMRFPSVHIAGTRGKGSTAAMCEAGLRAAGYRTGFYISPHLHTFRERIQVNREMISREDVVALVEEIRPFVERVPGITTFEAITAMGFLYLARAGVDVAVVEVGLGGRLDATNVLMPEVSIITSLSLEHTYLLGDTLDKIAYEKAGIIKSAVPAVIAPQQDEARIVLETVCRERGAPLTMVGRDWKYKAGPADLDGQNFSVRRLAGDESELDGEYWTPLLGRHQLENATCAIAAMDILEQRGFKIPAEAVREGLRTVDWPGRMEILSREPLVVIDCAHNPYAARMLRKALDEWFPDRRWVLVYGASVDKDISGVLTTLLPISDYVIVTRSDHPRAAAPAKLADITASVGGGAEISTNPTKALQRALAVMGPDDGLLVTGSIFLAADAREEWAQRMGIPLQDVDETED